MATVDRLLFGRALVLLWTLGGILDCVDDMGIAGAPAEIAFEPAHNFFARRFRMTIQDLDSGQDHARGAIPALQSMAFPEAALDRVQLALGRQTFDRGHLT